MVPPFDAATHTSAAVDSAIALKPTLVRPISTNRPQVSSRVAMVMPEIGFDELPISPVMRLDTVTKKKPNTTTRSAVRKSMSSVGARKIAIASIERHHRIERPSSS